MRLFEKEMTDVLQYSPSDARVRGVRIDERSDAAGAARARLLETDARRPVDSAHPRQADALKGAAEWPPLPAPIPRSASIEIRARGPAAGGGPANGAGPAEAAANGAESPAAQG